MDQLLNQLQTLLRPEVIGPLTALPIGLQMLKGAIKRFTPQMAAIVAAGGAIFIVLTAGWATCDWRCLALQCLLGWIYVEVLYRNVVEPMAKSRNPLVRPNASDEPEARSELPKPGGKP